MSSAWDQLEQMLTCPICLEKFKNPRLLPCEHSFCGDNCMEGLVDYARRQIKCPECRAEHRIPYEGVQNLPLNKTLKRFLDLHSRITGEEPEPVPTFLVKCSICSEKVEGVTRCAHCEKKVCPECKEAHVDILRREVGRINGQTKRCLNKLQDFREQVDKAQSKLKINHQTVKKEIQDSCRRLMDDLEAKQKQLIADVDSYAEQEYKTLDKLRLASKDELAILDSNCKLAEERFQSPKYNWTDAELWELKEIYARSMEFIRLFDADLGDFSRKIRFMIIPEFDTIKKRLCELGELKFTDTTATSMANALQYCNATGSVAIDICQAAAMMAASAAANSQASTGYSLSHSNSNTKLGLGVGGSGLQPSPSGLLELPGMQNALMRSQSDHRLASQFQARLKQQQREQQQQLDVKTPGSRYLIGQRGAKATGGSDYESESLRSRYGPPRSSIGGNTDTYDSLTRDWPRPSDNEYPTSDSHGVTCGIQFKSAFMRRKGAYSGTASSNGMDDDDDLVSEASYGGASRNVRFNEPSSNDPNHQTAGDAVGAQLLFDCRELEHAPLSGTPKLEDSIHLSARIHQMGAKAEVDKKQAEEERIRDKDLIEASHQAMNRAKQIKKQQSEDEIEKQKKANKQEAFSTPNRNSNNERASSPELVMSEREPEDLDEPEPELSSRQAAPSFTTSRSDTSSVSTLTRGDSASSIGQTTPTAVEPQSVASTGTSGSPAPGSTTMNSRRNLYSQAITEKSRRQLANAIQEASNQTNRATRSSRMNSQDGSGGEPGSVATADSPGSASSSSGQRPRRTLRSSGRSISKQNSSEQLNAGSDTGTIQRRPRRAVTRADSSNNTQPMNSDNSQSSNPVAIDQLAQSKNYTLGSVGRSGDGTSTSPKRPEPATQKPSDNNRRFVSRYLSREQATNTTDEDDDLASEATTSKTNVSARSRINNNPVSPTSSSNRRFKSYHNNSSSNEEELDEESTPRVLNPSDDSDDDSRTGRGSSNRYSSNHSGGHRRSREFLPNAVNKLLDRSAQIRRDSQEARSRGDSPQRTTATSGSGSSLGSYHQTSRDSNARTTPAATTTAASSSYSPSSLGSGTTRHRYAYQSRSQSGSKGADDDGTPAATTSYGTTTSASRRSSNEDNNELGSTYTSRRRTSKDISSAESGVKSTSRDMRRSNYNSSRQDSVGDSPSTTTLGGSSSHSGGFQSRFLSRSRTSSALADSSLDSSIDSPQRSLGGSSSSTSRDRFMQSTNAALSSGTTTDTNNATTGGGSSSTSSNYYSRTGPASAARYTISSNPVGHSRYQPSSLAHYSDDSPFIELEDEDDRYSAYFPSVYDRRTPSNESYKSIDDVSLHESKDENPTNASDDDESNPIESGASSSRNDKNKPVINQSNMGDEQKMKQVQQTIDSSHESPYENRSKMMMKIGSRGSQSGQFTWPRGVVADSNEILVADSSNHRVQVFDLEGNWLREFGSYGSAEGQFDCLAGVAINQVFEGSSSNDRRYVVSDRYNHRVQVFDGSGDFQFSFGSLGRNSGEFNLPWGVACSNDGLICVCDKENHRIQVFNHDGRYLSKLGTGECGSRPGQMQFPHYLALNGNGQLAVTDTNNHRVIVFDYSTGQVVTHFGLEGSQVGEFRFPRGIAVDKAGYFVVGDSGNNRLQIFDPRARLVKTFGSWGTTPGQFKGIEGVAIEPQGGKVLVCDRENHRIQIF